MVVVFELCMKLRWLGLHTFIRHKRTMVKVMGPSPYGIVFHVTFKLVSSVQFHIPRGLSPALRSVTLGPVLALQSLALKVMVMLTGAIVIRHLVCAKPWRDSLCGRRVTLPSLHPAIQTRMGCKSQRLGIQTQVCLAFKPTLISSQ